MDSKKYGYFSISRKLKKSWLHPSIEGRKFTNYEAWVWIIENANFACSEPRIMSGKLIIIPRSYLATNVEHLSEVFKWDRRTVNKFLQLLSKDGMIKCYKINPKSKRSCTLIKVSNYNEYQPEIASSCTSKYTSRCKLQCTLKYTHDNKDNNNINNKDNKKVIKDHVYVSPKVDTTIGALPSKEDKNPLFLPYKQDISCTKVHDNNEKNVSSKEDTKKEKTQRQKEKPEPSQRKHASNSKSSQVDADLLFDNFWNSYPKREGKAQAKKAWQKALKKAKIDEIMAGIEKYNAKLVAEQTSKQFTKMASTWLNGEHWQDEYDINASRSKPIQKTWTSPYKTVEELRELGEW